MAADVANSLKSWSSTESSNSPSGSTAISTNLDDNLRMIQKVVRDAVAAQDTIASASTTDLGTKDAGTLTVTVSAATITSFGTVSAGIRKRLIFSGALTLTHNATSLILPSAANIVTAAGDTCEAESLGSGNWRVVAYTRADGSALASQTVLADGSVGTPSLRFSSDANTGIYWVGADQIGLSTGGVQRAVVSTTGINVVGNNFNDCLSVTAGSGNFAKLDYITDGFCRLHIYHGGAGGVPASPVIYCNLPNASGTNNVLLFTNSGGNAFRVQVDGAVYSDGAYSGSGADYAEAFLYVGDEPQPGDTVVLVGDKVRKALYGEVPIGVISEKPCAIGDAKLLDQGAVPVGLIGKLRINQGCPIAPSWINLAGDLYLVR